MAGTKVGNFRSGRSSLVKRTHADQRQRAAADAVDVLAFQFQVLGEDLQHLRRHRLVDFDAHYIGEAALPHAFFDRLQQVAGFQVLNLAVGIAGDVEGMRFEDRHAGKQVAQVGSDQLLQPDERLLLDHRLGAALRLGSPAQWDQLRQRIGNLDARKVLFAFAAAQHHRQIQAQVRDVRKRPSGIEGQRRQRGKNGFLKVGVRGRALLFASDRHSSGCGFRPRPERAPAPCVQES